MASFAIMKARLVVRERVVFEDGHFVEMVVWQVPSPVPPSSHEFKYRLVYIEDGVRIVGFDNERGKGDHMHVGSEERSIAFLGIDHLLESFVLEVARVRKDR